jgi:hypothetical protein
MLLVFNEMGAYRIELAKWLGVLYTSCTVKIFYSTLDSVDNEK